MKLLALLASLASLASLTGCAHRTLPALMNHRLSPDLPYCGEIAPTSGPDLPEVLASLDIPEDKTGVLLLEQGASALIARAWLAAHATQSIDAQYFIFAADNTGLIVTDALILAAERGIKVRLLVDASLPHGDPEILQALSAHPNAEVRVYNPTINIGRTTSQTLKQVATDFRGANQRMHNKVMLVDGQVAITGGRNIAAEYFDLRHESNFRDRDVLLVGGAAGQVQASFDEFWGHGLSVPIEDLMDAPLPHEPATIWPVMHQYACNPDRFLPEMRARIDALPASLAKQVEGGELHFVDQVDYVSDPPSKNDEKGMWGASLSTYALLTLVRQAEESVTIQSPYLVTTELGLGLFAGAVERGVRVRILTNSLAATDNLAAFSGYRRSRDALLAAGVEIFEFKPRPSDQGEIMNGPLEQRTFSSLALHAKSMVIDGRIGVVGTFNLDPRSANLNTEAITIIQSEAIAGHLLRTMETEMGPDNAWAVTLEHDPDAEAPLMRRALLNLLKIIPKSVL